MKFFGRLALAILTFLAACTPGKNRTLTEIRVDKLTFQLDGREYKDVDGMVLALKEVQNLEAIYLKPSEGVPFERIAITVNAIKSAGINVPIGMVGVEVF